MRNSNKNRGVIIATAILSCVSIVGVGYSAFVFGSGLANGTILVGVNAAQVVENDGYIHVKTAPTVSESLKIYNTGFEYDNVIPSTTAVLSIQFYINFTSTATCEDDDSYNREFDVILGYEGSDTLDLCYYITGMTFSGGTNSGITTSSVTLTGYNSTNKTYCANVKFYTSATSGNATVAQTLTFTFSYTGSAFETDIYTPWSGITSSNFTLNYTTS